MLFVHKNAFMATGVLLRTTTTTHGTRISTMTIQPMSIRTTTIRTTLTMFAVLGILNKAYCEPR